MPAITAKAVGCPPECGPPACRPREGNRRLVGRRGLRCSTGPGTAFERPGLTWGDFPDGLGNTALVVEAGDPVPWSKPGDVVYDPAGPLPRLGGVYTKPTRFLGYEFGRHPGFGVCLADGTGRFVRASTAEPLLRALVTRNGGESFDVRRLE